MYAQNILQFVTEYIIISTGILYCYRVAYLIVKLYNTLFILVNDIHSC